MPQNNALLNVMGYGAKRSRRSTAGMVQDLVVIRGLVFAAPASAQSPDHVSRAAEQAEHVAVVRGMMRARPIDELPTLGKLLRVYGLADDGSRRECIVCLMMLLMLLLLLVVVATHHLNHLQTQQFVPYANSLFCE